MRDKEDNRGTFRPKSWVMFAAVGLGMAFFISGFVLTVTSMSHPDGVLADSGWTSSDASDSSSSLSLLVGLLLSLAGVVLATAGPAMYFIHGRRESA